MASLQEENENEIFETNGGKTPKRSRSFAGFKRLAGL